MEGHECLGPGLFRAQRPVLSASSVVCTRAEVLDEWRWWWEGEAELRVQLRAVSGLLS